MLRSFGLVETDASRADLRVVNTCSVTGEAASKSRQASRRIVRLPVLDCTPSVTDVTPEAGPQPGVVRESLDGADGLSRTPAAASGGAGGLPQPSRRPRVIVTGCWATSDRDAGEQLPGVDAVLTHHGDVAAELQRLLLLWRGEEERGGRQPAPDASASESADTSRPQRERHAPADSSLELFGPLVEPPPERFRNDGWIENVGLPARARTTGSKAESGKKVNLQMGTPSVERGSENPPAGGAFFAGAGTTRLPLLGQRQGGRQRAFIKVQDGCNAHCTYCIIPRLPRRLEQADRRRRRGGEAHGGGGARRDRPDRRLPQRLRPFDCAERRRGSEPGAEPLAELVEALCGGVAGLRRLRLSSLEPGDLTERLTAVLRDHAQVVPHFHLPLQSGSDLLLRRMNRQYSRRLPSHARPRARRVRPAGPDDGRHRWVSGRDGRRIRTDGGGGGPGGLRSRPRVPVLAAPREPRRRDGRASS